MAHFGSIFPIFHAKKIFLENPALSHTTSYGFLAPCQNLEKVNDTIQRKRPDRRKDRRTDGQTLFYRTLPTTAEGSKNRVEETNNEEWTRYLTSTDLPWNYNTNRKNM